MKGLSRLNALKTTLGITTLDDARWARLSRRGRRRRERERVAVVNRVTFL